MSLSEVNQPWEEANGHTLEHRRTLPWFKAFRLSSTRAPSKNKMIRVQSYFVLIQTTTRVLD